MASVNLSGILLNPEGEPDEGAIVKFTLLSTTGGTVQSSTSTLLVPYDGAYDIDLVYGNMRIDYISGSKERFVAIVTINADTVATSLPELLSASTPPTDAQLLQFQALLADSVNAKDQAVTAKDAAETAAATLDLVNDLTLPYVFDTAASYQASTIVFPVGKVVKLLDRNAEFKVISGTGTANGFDIIGNTTTSQSASLNVVHGTVSTKQLGTTKSATDYLTLQHAANNSNWKKILIEDYSPIGGYVYVDRAGIIFDGLKQLIDFTGVSNPMLVLGEQANGSPSTSAPVDIQVNNIRAIGDKTAGSRVVFFRKASTCIFNNWVAWFLATPFNGDGEVAVGYESLVCKFYNMDFRFNTIGFDDSAGSFQASTFYGGRIEANDYEGVRTKTTNLEFNGTVIEGNDVLLTGVSQVLATGGGSLQFSKCYMELKGASPNQAFITVGSGSTKRISFIGGDYYGQNTGPETALLVSGTNWTLGSLTVVGANLNEVNRICDRAGAVGNWHGSFDYWANVQLADPELSLNGASYSVNERIDGFKAKRIRAVERVTAENFQVQQVGSNGFSREFQRFIGRVSVGGAGDWHQVIDLNDVGAAASTAIRFDLYFFERGGDFQFYTTIMLSGTSTLKTKEDVSGNWASSLYRINAGFLEVDNLPASNRDWSCRIVATKGTTS